MLWRAMLCPTKLWRAMLCQTKLWRAMLCILILLCRPKRGPEATRQVDERLCDGILIAMNRAV